MRVLIISDIHANLPALEAVLADAGPVDAVWCLGDLVGYGPDPNECVSRVQDLPNLTCLIGNHDAAALGQIEVEAFNSEARDSIHWLKVTLSPASRAFLSELPEQVVIDRVTLAHGSPRNPVWEYILDTRIAKRNFEYFDTDFCVVGHTHLPVVYLLYADQPGVKLLIPEPGETMEMIPRQIINPGSVGQPRDRDPRAAYAIYNAEASTWEHHRVAYDVGQVQKRILDAGLPERHALRLSEGW